MRAFIPNPLAEQEMSADPDVQSNLAGIANGIAARAMSFSNEILPAANAPDPLIRAETDVDGVAVVTYDSGWHFDEFGNAYNPPNAPLRRGVGAAGFRFEDEPRA